MSIETEIQNYRLKGNPVSRYILTIGNLIHDERGKEIIALHNERFRGIADIEDTTEYKDEQPLSLSNVPRVLSYAQLLRERFPDMSVLSPEEVIEYEYAIPEKEDTYADTNSIAIFPNAGPNEELRKQVLDIIGRNPKKLKIPITVSELGVEKADNKFGFKFTETPYIKVREALYLAKDGTVRYDTIKGVVSSDDGIRVWTPPDQSGLRRLYRLRDGELYAWLISLLYSKGSGRVQVIQYPQGRAENLEAKLSKLKEQAIKEINSEYQNQLKEIESRRVKALEIIKGN